MEKIFLRRVNREIALGEQRRVVEAAKTELGSTATVLGAGELLPPDQEELLEIRRRELTVELKRLERLEASKAIFAF